MIQTFNFVSTVTRESMVLNHRYEAHRTVPLGTGPSLILSNSNTHLKHPFAYKIDFLIIFQLTSTKKFGHCRWCGHLFTTIALLDRYKIYRCWLAFHKYKDCNNDLWVFRLSSSIVNEISAIIAPLQVGCCYVPRVSHIIKFFIAGR